MPLRLPPLDRRRFLAGTLASAGLAALPRPLWAEPAVDPGLWLLWSDTHVAERRDEVHRGVNMAEHLQQAADEVLALGSRPAGLLLDGDCAFHHGRPGDYGTFVELLQPLTAAGIDLHFTLGNHDHRRHFWEALPSERGAALSAGDAPSEADEKHVALIEGRDVDWILLDSLQATDVTPGRLGERQMRWLVEQLDAGDKPACVLAHHHPTTTPVGGGLMDTVVLFEILDAHPRVKAYIFGHTHRWKVADRNGIHLINLPPVAYPFNPGDPCGWVTAEVRGDGMQLELHSLDKTHARHGERVDLKWRAG